MVSAPRLCDKEPGDPVISCSRYPERRFGNDQACLSHGLSRQSGIADDGPPT
jgi:hypothetical protein